MWQRRPSIGVPDARDGRGRGGFVVPTPRTTLPPPELEDAVRQHCVRRLARFKQPAEINVVDELPHTATGKVAKGRLRAGRRRQNLGLLDEPDPTAPRSASPRPRGALLQAGLPPV